MIELSGVTKVYHAVEVETYALTNINFAVRPGEFVTISGPSGSGKTTLLSILGLLDVPSLGRYRLAGTAVDELGASATAELRNVRIGFVFQAFNLIDDLTVFENVELPLTYRDMPPYEAERRVHEALERVGMSHRTHHFPSQLSGGQQQRVAVARAVAGDPAIVLADEPTGNLDSSNGETVMELLADLHRDGSTVCMVTHDPRYERFSDRTVHLADGRIVERAAA